MSLPACVEYDRLLSLIVRPSNAADQGRRLVLGRHWVEACITVDPADRQPGKRPDHSPRRKNLRTPFRADPATCATERV